MSYCGVQGGVNFLQEVQLRFHKPRQLSVYLRSTIPYIWSVLNTYAYSILVRQMIYHRGGKPERADLSHGTQAMDNSRICHRLLFHERGKQYFVLLRLHTPFN